MISYRPDNIQRKIKYISHHETHKLEDDLPEACWEDRGMLGRQGLAGKRGACWESTTLLLGSFLKREILLQII